MSQSKFKCISVFLLLLLYQLVLPISLNNICIATNSEDIYDVILFWGQSNMLGTCGKMNPEKIADTRYNNNSNSINIDKYSEITGINKTFLTNAYTMNYIKINQIPNTVYEYKYITNSLDEFTIDTKQIGEVLLYNPNTKKLEGVTSSSSISRSYGTNMIPQFCKTYYEQTGHKVVAVFGAHSGYPIANFLPSTDVDYGDENNKMVYEAMITKYKAAINFLTNKGYTIGQKFWVSYQGETDASSNISSDEYKRLFLKVHNNLKKDLHITKGAIVKTARTIGTYYSGTQTINQAQSELISENKDIILGSSFAYDNYIPDKTNYEKSSYKNIKYTDSAGNKLSYEKALENARYSVCFNDNSEYNNAIHLTSSALCQIGYESALNLSDLVPPTLTITYNTTSPTNKNVIVTITANKKIHTSDGWEQLSDTELTKTFTNNTSENVTIVDIAGNKSVAEIHIENIYKILGDTNQNDRIDIGDILLLLRHMAQANDNTIKQKHPEWKMNDNNITIGDVNKNNIIDIGDILKLSRFISATNSTAVSIKHPEWLILDS